MGRQMSSGALRIKRMRDSAEAAKTYRAEVARERAREEARDLMYGLVNAVFFGGTSELGQEAMWVLDDIEESKVRAKEAAEVDEFAAGGRLAISKQWVRAEDDAGTPVEKKVKVRNSTLSVLHQRGVIDDTHLAAAVWFREKFERAGIGQIKSMDYEKPMVDGGTASSDMSEGALLAAEDLARCRERVVEQVGAKGYQALEEIVGYERSAESVASSFSKLSGQSGRRHVTGTLVDALDQVVSFRGMVAKGKTGAKIVASSETVSGPSGTLTVGESGSISMVYPALDRGNGKRSPG